MAADLLDLPAPHGVRRIALGFLGDATHAHARFARGDDGEALHDFRVALRRLRSWLRSDAWSGGGRPRKLAKRARRIARATNSARDAEVLLAWAASQPDASRARQHRAIRWLTDWLHAREGHGAPALQDALADFQELESAWREMLAIVHIEERVDEPAPVQTFREHASALIASRCDALAAAMAAIKGPKDHEHIHGARIAGKRLRYAIEPLAPGLADAKPVIAAMKTVQDDFGVACDRVAFVRLLAKAARAAGKQAARADFARALSPQASSRRRTPSVVPQIIALAQTADTESRAQYRQLRQRYLGTSCEHVLDPARRLAEALMADSAEIP
jgi:CHAD domain-containing protein